MGLRGLLGHLPMYAEDLLPACLVIALVVLLEWRVCRRRGWKPTGGHLVGELLFGLYLVLLVQMTVPFGEIFRTLTREGWVLKGNVMLEPFREIRNFWRYGSRREKLINLLGNLVAFVPMGFFPALLWRPFRKLRWSWLWWVIPTLTVETLQLFTDRATSVDDVLLNALGGFLGYLLFRLLRPLGVGERTVWQGKAAGGRGTSGKKKR